jgi:arylsulfatase A-like enzyme
LEGGNDTAYRNNRIVNRWLRNRRARPFFLFLHYMGGHAPYLAPRAFAKRFAQSPRPADEERLRKMARKGGYSFMAGRLPMYDDDWAVIRSWYDAKVACLDSRLAHLFRILKRGNLLQNTVVVFTADHGENFGEHALAYHDFCLYDTLLHVPLLLYAPSAIEIGQVDDTLVSHVDLVPTFLSLANPAFDEQPYPGRNLLSTARGHEAVFAEYGPPRTLRVFERMHPDFDYQDFNRVLKSMRTTQWKYILAKDGQEELYDVTKDPRETSNQASEMPELCLEMRTRLEHTLPDDDSADETAFEDKGYSPREEAEIMAHLRELGYA